MNSVADEPRGAIEQLLCCEFCQEAEFEDHEEKAEHERNCEAACVTVRLPKVCTCKHTTGLYFSENESSVWISKRSEMFRYAEEIRAVATDLFSPASEHWVELDEDTFNALVDFGKKYMRQHHGSVKQFNDGSMRAALLQTIKPRDIIESIKYTRRIRGEGSRPKSKKETICLSDVYEGDRGRKLDSILTDEERFPVELSVKRVPRTQKKEKQSSDPREEIDQLSLQGNSLLWEVDWNIFVGRLLQFTFLKELNLDRNWIGRDGCRALTTLLRAGPLEWLSLKQNRLDDECITMIVEALKHNTTLTNLYLNSNDGITGRGQDDLFDLIGNTTSINDMYLSNHTIRCLNWDCVDSAYYTADDASSELRVLLGFNRYRNDFDPGRQKVWCRYFCNKRLDLTPLLEMDIAIIPHLLAWITMLHGSEGKRRFRPQFSGEGEHIRHVQHIVRDWNVPALFGFLSADRSRIIELEEIVRSLKAEVGKLKKQNNELREENCALKGEGTDSLKRKRGN
ncbi:hypothetical protein ACHAXT_006106 [Thalassiosira profunda]